MAETLTFETTVVTLASSANTLLVNRNTKRQYLAIQNTGAATISVSFYSSVATAAGRGISLDPSATSSGSGAQGGVWEWTEAVPSNSIYGYSAAGTTVVIIQA